jgi:histidinol phosphatase-like PHP family hydrolase
MDKATKKEAIGELRERFSRATNFYLADSSHMNVDQINKLRRLCHKEGVEFKVAKNTLIRKALEAIGGINANPYRLDIDYTLIPYALKKGVMISVNPDAHSIGEIDNIHWGVVSARKGGLTKEMTWNARPLGEIEKWLNGRRVKKGI